VIAAGLVDSGTWSACFGLSYRDTIVADLLAGRRIVHEIRHVAGSGQIATGRNNVTAVFLDGTEAQWLWFVDSDMGWTVADAQALFDSADPVTAPIVGGLCFGLRRTAPGRANSEHSAMFPTLLRKQGSGFVPWWDYPRDQMVEVDATGAAFLLIHRDVIEKMRVDGDSWFTPVASGDQMFSEDISFCIRAANHGYRVRVNTAAKTVHHKGAFYLSEQLYDAMRGGHGTWGSVRESG